MGSPAPAVCSRQICWPINVIINGWRRWKCRKWRGVRITMMTHVWEINFPVSAIRVTACHNTDTSYTDIRCFITLLKQYLWCVPSVYIEQGASLNRGWNKRDSRNAGQIDKINQSPTKCLLYYDYSSMTMLLAPAWEILSTIQLTGHKSVPEAELLRHSKLRIRTEIKYFYDENNR